MKRLAYCAVFFLMMLPAIVLAQKVTVTGRVKGATEGEYLASISVSVKNSNQGTFTDPNGNFKISLPSTTKFPVILLFSSTGYDFKEISVASSGENVEVSLQSRSTLGEEVVVSATKTPQRILESPVSIERLSNTAIRNLPAADYLTWFQILKVLIWLHQA